ncbi:ABC transporter substrate-binding protein [Actinoallomurus rhizosphaericola]|uniref:ABC transporter substrate-binding protein n=1 Tax=Actinoallomurus rhizosphaericola TaxID=2952536 RepID=UPI0020923997|nr:ABC transporter substrate-binding protein [Actinoallomurus rhizosphaericola]MCO5999202.1 ABC transporter substrate-binding protein [Actinoallomurus rhizosphaericola]
MKQRSSRRSLLGAVLALGLCACGCSGGSGDPAGGGPITWASFKEPTGTLRKIVDGWNSSHPGAKVTLVDLPEAADAQRRQLVQNAQIRSTAFDVVTLDAVWTAEFAANRWVEPLTGLDTGGFLAPSLRTGQYRGRLYAAPWLTGAGLLYYRTDLLAKAGVSRPPRTWQELTDDCAKVRRSVDIGCYAGQYDEYEGLTVNVTEAIDSAGGRVLDASGRPALNTPEALAGLRFLTDGLQRGLIPKAALTYQEENGRRAFEAGDLLFHRNWGYVYALAGRTDGSSRVAGRFAVAPLPGRTGPGVSTLGGNNVAISAYSKHKRTALEFIRYVTGVEAERTFGLGSAYPMSRAALYSDPAMVKAQPYLPTLAVSIRNAVPRPEAVRYGDVTTAIQEAAYTALRGRISPEGALARLQAELGPLTAG